MQAARVPIKTSSSPHSVFTLLCFLRFTTENDKGQIHVWSVRAPSKPYRPGYMIWATLLSANINKLFISLDAHPFLWFQKPYATNVCLARQPRVRCMTRSLSDRRHMSTLFCAGKCSTQALCAAATERATVRMKYVDGCNVDV
jgi:hypothetical protein